MKRFLAALLALTLLLSLAACGSGNTGSGSGSPASSGEIASDPAREAEPYPAADAFAGGSGTESDPYQIADAGQLAYLSFLLSEESDSSVRYQYNGAWYVLTADIVLNDAAEIASWGEKAPAHGWTPIGSAYPGFLGHFDGQGHTVSGLYVYSVTAAAGSLKGPGLFSSCSGAEIRNLAIADSRITALGANGCAGSLAGAVNDTVLSNCSSSAVVEAGRSCYAGGLVGESLGVSAEFCSFTGQLLIRENCSAGGIIGNANGAANLTGCVNAGGIVNVGEDSSETAVGGVIGCFFPDASSVLMACSNRADLSLGDGAAGGLAGKITLSSNYDVSSSLRTADSLLISACGNSGAIGAEGAHSSAGGLVGSVWNEDYRIDGQLYVSGLVIEFSENKGAVRSGDKAGGIVGTLNVVGSWTVNSCINSGSVSAAAEAGGIVGSAPTSFSDHSVRFCTNNGEISSDGGRAGGIVCTVSGISLSSFRDETPADFEIYKCRNYGSVSGGSSIGGLGGILGALQDVGFLTRVEGCLNEGTISGGDACRLGGIVGDTLMNGVFSDAERSIEITHCVNRGDLVERRGETLFTEELQPTVTLTEPADTEAAAVMVLGGSAAGGICGVLAKGEIVDCVSTGRILLDPDTTPVFTHEQLFYYSNEGETRILFCGGICGAIYGKEEAPVRIADCAYAEPTPLAGFVVFSEDGMENLSCLSADEADHLAEKILRSYG